MSLSVSHRFLSKSAGKPGLRTSISLLRNLEPAASHFYLTFFPAAALGSA